MHIASSSESEQRTLKRKTADSSVEHSPSPDSRAKRRRSSANHTDKHPTSRKTPDPDQILSRPDGKFYYDTGDIYLVVERTFFCVHAKKLQAAGGIFEDLLSGNVRPSEDEFLYGLPAINVPLVSLRQFRYFLAHIYDTIELRAEYPDIDDNSCLYWEAAVELLDVSKKLNLYEVRKSVISALECLFPTNITEDRIPKFRPIIAGYRHQAEEKMFYRTFPIKAIKLFREHDVPTMLPMAYYHAAQLSLDDIVNGVEDGGVLWKLDTIDTIKVLKGRDKLKTSRRQVLFPWLDDKLAQGANIGIATCEKELMLNNNDCWENFMEIYSKFNKSGFLDDITNGLQGLSEKAEMIFGRYFCEKCRLDALGLLRAGERKNWESLPEYFGFEDWDALKKLQKNVDRGWEGEY